MNHEKWIELADLYAVGALDGGDATEFHSHLDSGCELCEYRIVENESALSALVKSLPQMQPPAHLKSLVMDGIPADFSPVAVKFTFNPVWAALAWILLSGLVIAGWKATSLERHTQEFKRMETALLARDQVKALEMKSTDEKASVMGKVMWGPKGDCLFMTMGLPHPSKEKTYQLWGILDGQKISAGIFQVDEHGCGILAMKDFAPDHFEKLAVTLEPAGGVPSPTGPIVLLGSF